MALAHAGNPEAFNEALDELDDDLDTGITTLSDPGREAAIAALGG